MILDFFLWKYLYSKVKEYYQLKKENQELKEEIKELEKEVKNYRKQVFKYISLKKGEMYVVNVCALYFASQNQIVLTSNKHNLLKETKGKKYRPIVITNVKPPNVKFIALSTFQLNQKEDTEKVDFSISNCKFQTYECFLPSIEKDSYIFGEVIKRKVKGKQITRIKGIEFSIPILLLKELEHIEASSKKEAIQEKCKIYNENYKLIKKCAKCDTSYIDKILKEIEEKNEQ
ncbi:hypothetical protein [Persephonella sp. KM09-Lau-8]|uniref:hypothetical protein n=1 Tax=Persephonella sp. KM09-Lau-8 TaxID=1158345 RepID=UPI000495B7E5|nr:hypothetical protein [Persephonella sp. KM09-Lau-8]